MKSTIFLSLGVLFISFSSYSQSKEAYYSNTVNDILFADYRVFENTNTVDSLLKQYPIKDKAEFKDLTPEEIDAKISINWLQFRDDFLASVNYEDYNFTKRKTSIYFTLHFSANGKLDYVLYNWLDGSNFLKMTDHFVNFTASYDFSGFPQGVYWSQCGTITLDTKMLKKNALDSN